MALTVTVPGVSTKKISVSTNPLPGVSAQSTKVQGVNQVSNLGGMLQGTGASLGNSTIQGPALPPAPQSKTNAYASIPFQTPTVAGVGGQIGGLTDAQNLAIQQAQAQQKLLEQAAGQASLLAQQKRQSNLSTLDQRLAELERAYQSNLTTANQGYASNLNLAQTQTGALNQAIDQNVASNQAQAETAKKTVQEQAARSQANIEDTLQRTFAARGALDSSFYVRELAKNLSGLEETKITQIAQIDQQLTQANQQAAQQKQDIQLKLQQTLSDLESKKADYLNRLTEAYNQGRVDINTLRAQADMDLAEFASNNELQRLQQLQQVQFNLDNYLNEIAQKKAQLVASVQGATGNKIDPFAAASQRMSEIQQAAVSILQNPANRSILQASITANGGADRANSLLQAADEYINSLSEDQKKSIIYGG